MSANSLPIKLEPILEQIQKFAPNADEKTSKAVELMASIETLADEDDVEYAEAILGKVKESYDKFSTERKSITVFLDEVKEFLMVYEKRVSYDGKTDNHYTRIRKMIVAFKQAELEKKQKVENEAKRRREIEDYKVTLETQIKKNLAEMVIERVVTTDEGSRKHFEKATLETFEEASKTFMGFKPILKEEFYNKCFEIQHDSTKLTHEEFDVFIKGLKAVEYFDKWKELVVEGLTPVLNDWRAKIPMLKEEKVKLSQAKDDAERQRLEKEQNDKAQAEANRKKNEFDQLKREANEQIDNEAEVNKMGNAFQEQGTVQEMGGKGPVTRVVRFTDEKNVVKPLANVIYNCFLSPKFPGIYKLDKSKQPVLDDQGAKQYNDHIDWFLDFFVKNCDTKVPGVEIKEVAKVIIRK